MLHVGLEALNFVSEKNDVPVHTLTEMLDYIEMNMSDVSADIVRQYVEIRDINVAIENLYSVRDLIEKTGVTPELTALVGSSLSDCGIDISSENVVKDIGSAIWKGIMWLFDRIAAAFSKLGKMISGWFTKKYSDAIAAHAAAAIAAVKDVKDQEATAEKVAEKVGDTNVDGVAQGLATGVGNVASSLATLKKVESAKSDDSKASKEAFDFLAVYDTAVEASQEAWALHKFPKPEFMISYLDALDAMIPLMKFMLGKQLELIGSFTANDISRIQDLIMTAGPKLENACVRIGKLLDSSDAGAIKGLVDQIVDSARSVAKASPIKRLAIKVTATLYDNNLKAYLVPGTMATLKTRVVSIMSEMATTAELTARANDAIAKAKKNCAAQQKLGNKDVAFAYKCLAEALQQLVAGVASMSSTISKSLMLVDRVFVAVEAVIKAKPNANAIDVLDAVNKSVNGDKK